MQTILMVVLLVLTITMIGTILLQRSEGGALGIGGPTGGLLSARGSANLLTRITAVLAALFMITSLVLAIIAGGAREDRSLMETSEPAPQAETAPFDFEGEPLVPEVPEATAEPPVTVEPSEAPVEREAPDEIDLPSVPSDE